MSAFRQQLIDYVYGELPEAERFLEAGRVAHKVAQLAHAHSAVERDWVPAGDGLVIEDWSIERGGERE